ANAAAAGGLPTTGTGANQIDLDASGRVNVGKYLGTLMTSAIAGMPDVNVKAYAGTNAATPSTLGLPDVNVTKLLNTAVSTPATAGILDVNVKNWVNAAPTGPFATAVENGVWDAARSSHVATGSFGQLATSLLRDNTATA